MKNTKQKLDYQQQVNLVTDYIYDHLDDQLDLYQLADIACMSPYHWHRVYQAVCGETAAATVKRLRLHRAAGHLAQTTLPIKEIARRSGYSNLQSFTRIFSSVYGMPPGKYRETGPHTHFARKERGTETNEYPLTIERLSEINVLSRRHIGSYMDIGKAFEFLYGWLGSHGLIKPGMRSVGIFYDDPTLLPVEQLRSRACVVLSNEVDLDEEGEIEQAKIAAGEYAVLRYQGPYATMRAAYQWLFGVWLVESGRELADQPVFEEYLNSPRDTDPAELLTDIYLPLK